MDETRFTPLLLDPLLKKHKAKIKQVYVSRNLLSFNFFKRFCLRFIRCGYPFCIRAGDLSRFAVEQVFKWGKYSSIDEFLNQYGLETKEITALNTLIMEEELASLDPDIFLFCPFDKIAGPKVLTIPRNGVYNVHLGKLPEYRGGYSSFWVLRFNDPTGGASIHRAISELDAGELFAEVRVPVREKSMNSLMMDTVIQAGEMVSQFIDDLDINSLKSIDTSKRSVGYFYLPNRNDFKEFYKLNCRLI